MPVRRMLAVALVLAAVAGAVYFQIHKPEQSRSDELTLYGNIDIREVDLPFNVAGRIKTMLVEEGDPVEAGQLLAELDDRIYQAQVSAARSQAAAQQAAVDRLLAGSRPQDIERLREEIAAIEADLSDAEKTLKRTQSLVLSDFATRQQLDDNTARVKSLTGRLNASKQALSLAIEGPRKEDIEQAKALLAARRAEFELVQHNLSYTKLKASAAGTVKTRILEPGSAVSAQSPVYTISLSDPVWARTYVSEPDLGRIRPGMAAEIFTDSDPGKPHEGWIGFISPSAEFTPKAVQTPEIRTSLVYRLRVYANNPDDSLRQGMPVTIRIRTEAPAPGTEAPANG